LDKQGMFIMLQKEESPSYPDPDSTE